MWKEVIWFLWKNLIISVALRLSPQIEISATVQENMKTWNQNKSISFVSKLLNQNFEGSMV